MPCVYLLHFERPYRHARHYSGFAQNLSWRIKHHRNGTGARLTQVIKENGIRFAVVKVWPGEGRTYERKVKRRGNARLCPVCSGELRVCFDCGKLYKTDRWLRWHREHVHNERGEHDEGIQDLG